MLVLIHAGCSIGFVLFCFGECLICWVFDQTISCVCLQVKADVTDGSAKLAEAISDDSDAVICATGFSYGWDVFAPWKVNLILLSVQLTPISFTL